MSLTYIFTAVLYLWSSG